MRTGREIGRGRPENNEGPRQREDRIKEKKKSLWQELVIPAFRMGGHHLWSGNLCSLSFYFTALLGHSKSAGLQKSGYIPSVPPHSDSVWRHIRCPESE